jgi:hypothetical protein
MITVEFLITSLIVVLIPGTGVVFTVSFAVTFAGLGTQLALSERWGLTVRSTRTPTGGLSAIVGAYGTIVYFLN